MDITFGFYLLFLGDDKLFFILMRILDTYIRAEIKATNPTIVPYYLETDITLKSMLVRKGHYRTGTVLNDVQIRPIENTGTNENQI